jgi:hypothetical protein
VFAKATGPETDPPNANAVEDGVAPFAEPNAYLAVDIGGADAQLVPFQVSVAATLGPGVPPPKAIADVCIPDPP